MLNRNLHLRPAPGSIGGFMLVEVLVTTVILTIGLLGIIGLQTMALSSSHLSSLRTEAMVMASDMADRMRANLGAVNAPAGSRYDDAVASQNGCRAAYANSTEPAPVSCTPQELAADDIFDWVDLIGQDIPGGAGAVCLDSTPDDGVPATPACDGVGNAYAIKVWWTERSTSTQGVTVRRYVMTVRP